MHDDRKLTGPEWEALVDAIAGTDPDLSDLYSALNKINDDFRSEQWHRCPVPGCAGWLGPVMREEERIISCSECGRTGYINTYGDDPSFRDYHDP